MDSVCRERMFATAGGDYFTHMHGHGKRFKTECAL
jgi:hypothetical protein